MPFGPPGKNGTTELHYFPKLGGEFFFYEPDVAEYSQVHASPSTDLYRVEIESKVDRLYEWVLHHIEPVREVTQVLPTNKFEKVSDKALLKPGAWWYDAPAKSLHIRVFAPKGADVIVNAVF